jgi:hypothetical protein
MDAAKAVAPFCHAKPTVVPGDAAVAGPMIIDALTEEDRAIIDARLDRYRDLELKDLLGTDLGPADEAELERLHAWYETLPPHLTGQDADDIELRRLLAEDDQKPVVHYEPPGEHRRRIEAARAPIDVKATAPVEEPEDDQVCEPVWPADIRRDDDLDVE